MLVLCFYSYCTNCSARSPALVCSHALHLCVLVMLYGALWWSLHPDPIIQASAPLSLKKSATAEEKRLFILLAFDPERNNAPLCIVLDRSAWKIEEKGIDKIIRFVHSGESFLFTPSLVLCGSLSAQRTSNVLAALKALIRHCMLGLAPNFLRLALQQKKAIRRSASQKLLN